MPSIEITQIRYAKSLNEENTHFDLEIDHPEFGWSPYGLDPNDPDNTIDNAQLLALMGSNYEAYVPPTEEEILADATMVARNIRDDMLTKIADPIISNPLRWSEMTEEKREEWRQYRLDLLNAPSQDSFPLEVFWPTKPT